MKLKFYDWETFPEWWCCVVSDEEDYYASVAYDFKFSPEEEQKIKDKMRVYTSDGGLEELKRFLADITHGVLTGYNSKRFDQIITRCVSLHFTPRQIFIAAMIIVNKVHDIPKEMNVTQLEIQRISQYVNGYSARWQGAEATQDLYDDADKGLKDFEAAVGMDIRETTVPFGKMNLTQEDKDEIIFYCKHDVFALHVKYVTVSRPYINTKLSLGKTYNIPEKVCYESTNAVLAGKVLGAERVHGTTIVDPTITIYEKPIREYIEKWCPKEALDHLIHSQKAKNMAMFENQVFMADGGLHSVFTTPKVDKEQSYLYVEADEEWGLFNIDLSGCHPSVMLFCGAMPRSITKPERFRESVFRRRRLKATPKELWTEEDKEFVPAGKLIHNTTYGAAGNKWLPLYDDYMRSKVCRVSQMVIIAVAMNVYTEIPNVKVIQTNTDGILLYMRREYLDKLKAIIKEFEDLSQFSFELEEDSKIWQLNVNNYIALNADGKDKLKGKSFITSIWQKGTNKVRPLGNHIIARCQYEWYVNKRNPVQMLLEHTKVDDFMLCCTKGSTYDKMIQETTKGPIELGKVTRVIATTTEKYGVIKKLKLDAQGNVIGSGDTCAGCPPHTWVINDALYNYHLEGGYTNRRLVHKDGSSAEVDMNYYCRLLDDKLNVHWYKFHKGQLTYTREFNL